MEDDNLEAQLEQLYNAAQSASSEGLVDEALRKCEEALTLLEEHGEELERYSYSDFVMLQGDIQWQAGNYQDAYKSYHRTALNDPERLDARIATGVALFHLCRFTAAQSLLEQCSLDDPEDAETWYYLGLLALRQGKREVALGHLETAAELQPNHFHLPVDVPQQEVVGLVEAMIEELPDDIREALSNIPIILEERPDDELLFSEDPPLDPTMLGLFDGVPYADQGSGLQTAPTRILLFSENLRLLAHDRELLEEELHITLKHEIGHFFGLSEEDLAERGLD